MAIRMTGLASGLDTESMVKDLMDAASIKVDNVKKDKQLAEWKSETWSSLNTQLYDFYKTQLNTFQSAGTYKTKAASTNDPTKAGVTAGIGAAIGTHTVSIKQVASSAYLTGTKLTSGSDNYKSHNGAALTTSFADMTDSEGNNLNLAGKTITISDGSTTVEYELGGSGDNGVANLKELNDKLAADHDLNGIRASISEGTITFTNNTDTGNDTDLKKDFTVESEALGLSGTVYATEDKEAGVLKTLKGTVSARVEKDFTSADISSATKLKDIGVAVGTTFSIKGQDFVVDETTTMASFASGLSKLGVNASYDAKQGRFYINSKSTGKDNDFNITASDSSALDKLGLGAGATKIDAKDAIIDYNGVEYTSASNTLSVNGLEITAKAVTGNYDETTGTMTNDVPISISVTNDVDSAYNSIKEFVKSYNTLIDKMNSLYNEKKTDYEPLTEDEKSSLSETQIEKWEEKAKQGILRRDSTLSSLLSDMRTILNKGVEITNDDGTKTTYTLSSLGIVTGDYTENGKLHILGDADDATYATQTNKLKDFLQNNAEVVEKVISGSNGVGGQMYSSLRTAMRHTTTSSALTFYDDISMKDEIDDYDDKIDDMEDKLKAMEDKYYDQFAKMESAMAALQSQQSYISSLMGGA